MNDKISWKMPNISMYGPISTYASSKRMNNNCEGGWNAKILIKISFCYINYVKSWMSLIMKYKSESLKSFLEIIMFLKYDDVVTFFSYKIKIRVSFKPTKYCAPINSIHYNCMMRLQASIA